MIAAGDIACDPTNPYFNAGSGSAGNCQEQATASLIQANHPSAVFALGDNQYENGDYTKFTQVYAPTWGQWLSITHPIPGNHEYYNAGAPGYFQYYGAAAGAPSQGWYSFDLGVWHIIALNGNCADVGGCGFGSPQEMWLRRDLAADRAVCTLAMWHQPRFSSGSIGNDSSYDAFWQDLYAAKADVVLNAHDHDYERFAPQTPLGAYDPHGIREFVVGTGGNSLWGPGVRQANSEVYNYNTFGVFKLTLHRASYDWQFIPANAPANGMFSDAGSGPCGKQGKH